MDAFLVFASTALAVMGGIALALSVVFRSREKFLTDVYRDSKATVFNRSFVVFEPYSQRTIFHRFLTLLPFVPAVLAFGAALLLLVIIEAGLLLTVVVCILGLSLIAVEESVEALDESKTLISAIKEGGRLGVGDVRLLTSLKKNLPKFSRYYLGLSLCFFLLVWILPLVWVQVLWGFGMFVGALIWVAAFMAPPFYLLVVTLYALGLVALSHLVRMAKTRILGAREVAA